MKSFAEYKQHLKKVLFAWFRRTLRLVSGHTAPPTEDEKGGE